MAFSPDGKRIVTASEDKTARLWDAESGKQIGEPLLGHTATVLSAAFSPDGKRIVTAAEDKTARLWDAESGKQIGEPLLGHTEPVLSAAFSPDGKRIVTASVDRTRSMAASMSQTMFNGGNEHHSREDGLPTIAIVEGSESYRERSPGNQEKDRADLRRRGASAYAIRFAASKWCGTPIPVTRPPWAGPGLSAATAERKSWPSR